MHAIGKVQTLGDNQLMYLELCISHECAGRTGEQLCSKTECCVSRYRARLAPGPAADLAAAGQMVAQQLPGSTWAQEFASMSLHDRARPQYVEFDLPGVIVACWQSAGHITASQYGRTRLSSASALQLTVCWYVMSRVCLPRAAVQVCHDVQLHMLQATGLA